MMKVIQAGIGGIGNVWLRTVLDSPEVEFAGFVEIDEDIAAKQVAVHGLTAIGSSSRSRKHWTA